MNIELKNGTVVRLNGEFYEAGDGGFEKLRKVLTDGKIHIVWERK